MIEKSIFEFTSYREYLLALTAAKGGRSGIKSELAAAMGGHPAYLSRVLGGKSDLNLEQAERIARHLNCVPEEKRYFILLVEEARASTRELKDFFRQQRIEVQRLRSEVQKRIPPSHEIGYEDQAKYYSAWYYSAIHVLVSVPGYQDPSKMAEHLSLSVQTIREAMRFLERLGVIREMEGRWIAGERHLHIARGSPFFRQHHSNWRLRSIQTLDREASDAEIRYSGVFSLSKLHVSHLQEQILKHLREYLTCVTDSPEETAYVLSIDFFQLDH